jgi:NADPH:quinone reductase-like Zn-dependent oxidoreductase
VLVDVQAASVNGADWRVRAGQYAPITSFLYVPGRDHSGVVSGCGAGVEEFAIGDAVFGVCDVSPEAAYTEKITIRLAIVSRKPEICTIEDT